MQAAGVRPDQVVQVRGFADQQLRVSEDPNNPSNRRISVIVAVPRCQATGRRSPQARPLRRRRPPLAGHLAYHVHMKRSAFLWCLSSFALFASDSIEAFGHKWTVPIGADWKSTPEGVLELLVPRPPTQPRRPSQYALAEMEPALKLEVVLEAKAERVRPQTAQLAIPSCMARCRAANYVISPWMRPSSSHTTESFMSMAAIVPASAAREGIMPRVRSGTRFVSNTTARLARRQLGRRRNFTIDARRRYEASAGAVSVWEVSSWWIVLH